MKILVYYLLVIFLEICYGAEVTYVDPKDPANDCGFDNGGPIMQQVTTPLVSPGNLYWSRGYKTLVFADEKVCQVYLYDPETGSLTTIEIHELAKESIKLLIPLILGEVNVYWLFTGDERYTFEILYDDDDDQVSNYILTDKVNVVEDKNLIVNQGRTDFNGRLFFGTEPIDNSNRKDSDLIKMETDGHAVVVNSDGISSQIAFNDNYKKMLILDEDSQQIFVGDYNLNEGTINETSMEPVFKVSDWDIKGSMVDAVFDQKGHIWIAFFGSGLIIKFDCESKTPVYNFTMAEESISSIVWGDKDLDVLYVATTAPEAREDATKHPSAGAIFAVSGLNAKGVISNDIFTTAT